MSNGVMAAIGSRMNWTEIRGQIQLCVRNQVCFWLVSELAHRVAQQLLSRAYTLDQCRDLSNRLLSHILLRMSMSLLPFLPALLSYLRIEQGSRAISMVLYAVATIYWGVTTSCETLSYLPDTKRTELTLQSYATDGLTFGRFQKLERLTVTDCTGSLSKLIENIDSSKLPELSHLQVTGGLTCDLTADDLIRLLNQKKLQDVAIGCAEGGIVGRTPYTYDRNVTESATNGEHPIVGIGRKGDQLTICGGTITDELAEVICKSELKRVNIVGSRLTKGAQKKLTALQDQNENEICHFFATKIILDQHN